MIQDLLKQAAWFIVFVLAQAIVLGRIHLFGFAIPLLYVYFVTQFPRNYPKWASLLWGFFLGLFIDIFSNTPGLAAASLTLIAAIQPYYFELFVPHDSAENLKPSISALGLTRYVSYVVPLVLLYCLVFFSLELFSFFNLTFYALCVGGSSAITLLLILALEMAKKR